MDSGDSYQFFGKISGIVVWLYLNHLSHFSILITMEDVKFSYQFEVVHPKTNDKFVFHKVEIGETLILNIMIDGIADTTMELPLNSQQAINILSELSNFEEYEESLGVEPRIIIGDHNNYKIQVIGSQIGKLLLKTLKEPKSVILSIGSRWFGKGDDTTDDDFDKLLFILDNLNKLIK